MGKFKTLAGLFLATSLSAGVAWADEISVPGLYFLDLTEVGGIPIPLGIVKLFTNYNADGTTDSLVWLPGPDGTVTQITGYKGNWKVLERTEDYVKVQTAYRQTLVDPDSIEVPGGECVLGCYEIGLTTFYVDKDGNFNGVTGFAVENFYTGEAVTDFDFIQSKSSGQKVDQVDFAIHLFNQRGIPIPDPEVPPGLDSDDDSSS